MIGCAGGCGREVEAPSAAGWGYLEITGRWRCGGCNRDLIAIRSTTGLPHDPGRDDLPSNSIGALKKLPAPLPLHEKVKP